MLERVVTSIKDGVLTVHPARNKATFELALKVKKGQRCDLATALKKILMPWDSSASKGQDLTLEFKTYESWLTNQHLLASVIGPGNVVIEHEVTETVPVNTEVEETDTEEEVSVQQEEEQPQSVFARVWNYMFAANPAEVEHAAPVRRPKKKTVQKVENKVVKRIERKDMDPLPECCRPLVTEFSRALKTMHRKQDPALLALDYEDDLKILLDQIEGVFSKKPHGKQSTRKAASKKPSVGQKRTLIAAIGQEDDPRPSKRIC